MADGHPGTEGEALGPQRASIADFGRRMIADGLADASRLSHATADQRSHAAQYLLSGASVSLEVAMAASHCSHWPKRQVASRASLGHARASGPWGRALDTGWGTCSQRDRRA